MGASAQIWLPTIPANAQGSTWGGTVNPVSAHVPISIGVFLLFLIQLSIHTARLMRYEPSELIDRRQLAGNSHKLHPTTLQ